MTQQTWKAWVRIGASPVTGPFIEDVTVYDCSQKPGYRRATITLDDDRAAAGREGAEADRQQLVFETFRDGYFAGLRAVADHIASEKTRIETEHAALKGQS